MVNGQRRSVDGSDVDLLVAEIRARMYADPELGPALGSVPNGRNGTRRAAADPLTTDLTRLVTHALRGREEQGTAALVGFLRHHVLDSELYDRFGHYVLTAALERRIGPDALLLIGAVLADTRRTIVRPGPRREERTTGR
jgi:hypothetical protein